MFPKSDWLNPLLLSAAPSTITPSGRQKRSVAFAETPSSSAFMGSTCQPSSRACA